MVVKLEIGINDNRLVLTGPLEEIKKFVVVCRADEGKVANIALDDALLVNDTIYQISKHVYRERDKLKHELEKKVDEAGCCPEEPDGQCAIGITIPTAFLRTFRDLKNYRYQCSNQFCIVCGDKNPHLR